MSEIPEWARYRATDKDGTKWYFGNEPKRGYDEWYITGGDLLIQQADEVENWEDSLEEIK